jgi:hypothetical protein
MSNTVDLQEIFVKKHEEKLKNNQKEVEECTAQLESLKAEDREFLTARGFGDYTEIKGKLERAIREKRVLEDGIILTESEISEICIKFGLRFGNVRSFTGPLPVELPEILKEYEKIHETVTFSISRSGGRNYFIIAPKEFFKDSPAFDPLDPILFEQLSWGTYRLVYKWGENLTMGRYYMNFPIRNKKVFTWMIYIPAILMLIALLGLIIGAIIGHFAPCTASFLSLLTLVGGVVALIKVTKRLSNFNTNDEKWNKPHIN